LDAPRLGDPRACCRVSEKRGSKRGSNYFRTDQEKDENFNNFN
jgi:hypothetical protein